MLKVHALPIPEGTSLHRYAQKPGYYTDCFAIDVMGRVALSDYIAAFYTTPLFKTERLILSTVANLTSSDLQAKQLALAKSDRFAAWTVEERTDAELLMDAVGRTWSWFLVQEIGSVEAPKSRLLFGSVVAPKADQDPKPHRIGFVFSSLLAAHRVYSRLLLAAAARRVRKLRP